MVILKRIVVTVFSSNNNNNKNANNKLPSINTFLDNSNNILSDKQKGKLISVYHYAVRHSKKLSKINGKSVEWNFEQIIEEQKNTLSKKN